MKKFLCILMSVITVLALCACGGETQPAAPEESKSSAFVFEAGNTTLCPGDLMADALKDLGDPVSYYEAESCAFSGLDKVYTYSGFTVSTRPDGDKDYITSILLTDDSTQTAEGIYIGSSEADVKSAYGEPAAAGDYVYTSGCSLNFVIQEGKVISIEYTE